MVDWIQGKNWSKWNETYGIKGDYGNGNWFHVYAFTMTLGVLVAIGVSAIKIWNKKLPLRELAIGAVIIVPVSLLGASFFGKLNAEGPGQNSGGVGFWGLFNFSKAGMAIHGGVYAGSIVGMIIFFFLGRRPKVSLYVYMDAIIPNILLGQGIGRWGNFFNHELPGTPIYDVTLGQGKNPLSWLPNFITENTQIWYSGPGDNINGLEVINGHLYQMEPIFLYESFGLILGWIFITFIIPGLGKWISKKPWKVDKDQYSFDLKYSFKKFFTRKSEEGKQTYWEVWDKAFYSNIDIDAVLKYEAIKDEINQKSLERTKGKNKFTSYFINYKYRWQKSTALVVANNPKGYSIAKSGIETGGYFLIWNLVRFILELRRPDDHLFLIYYKTLSLVIIGMTALAGLLLMILSQTIIPRMYRKEGFHYEKEYFVTK